MRGMIRAVTVYCSSSSAIPKPYFDAGAALGRALTDRDLAAALVESGEARAATFSMDRLADRYLDLYDRVRTMSPPLPEGAA